MAEYGVTDKGFVIKRLDDIMEEIHEDLTESFGFDTRLTKPSFLDTLITTFSGQISEVWEELQNSYYAKYPATATGINLDNAVQYGGIRRAASKRTSYPLHCTGDDGTYVREEAIVATDTSPEIRLQNDEEFEITREAFNRVSIIVASAENGLYSVTIGGDEYSYTSSDGDEESIIKGLAAAITTDEYTVTVEETTLTIEDKTLSRSNTLILSDNLTTSSVTVIATFLTEDYGKITLPYGIVTKMVNNITGFTEVTNLLAPVYGRKQESDIELRQSYLAKSALRSNTMIESIVGELLNNVENVESASGYENDADETDERGLPPHSIEIIVEGGDDNEIAEAILKRKAAGIQTYGNVEVAVPGNYGDTIPIRFNRPDYLYTWLKVVLHGDATKLPTNYVSLTIASLLEDGAAMTSGDSLLTQLLNDGIYDAVAGLTYIEIYTAYGTDKNYVPSSSDYQQKNIIVTSRQKVLIDETRIEVSFDADS
jgi:hypothetical protein